jgi:hypothetical protein
MRVWPTQRLWQWLAIGLAVLAAVGLIFVGTLAWIAERELQTRLDAIRAAGDPASIADLAPAAIPDDENAAAILERIGPQLSEFSKDHARFFDTSIGKTYEEAQDRGEPTTPEQIFEIRLILVKYPEVEEALAQAANCDIYASRLDYSLNHTSFIEAAISHQGTVRTAARLLAWRMEVLVADGFHEDAIENGIKILRLARHYENEPTVVPFLVAIAVRSLSAPQIYDALAAGPVSPKLHAALDKELAIVDTPGRLVQALKSERAVSADWVDAHLGSFPLLPDALGWQLKWHQSGVLDEIEEHLELADKPWHEVRTQFGPSNAPAPTSPRGKLADLLVPALHAVFHANARDLATMRSLRIYNVLRQFAEKHGREAASLEELGLPAAATTDPYSGQPLKLKHTADGWMVYSVMENGEDDGGDFMVRKDYGVAPRKRRLTE